MYQFQLSSKHLPVQSQQEKLQKKCQIGSKLTINTPQARQYCRLRVFTVTFEHLSRLRVAIVDLLTGKCLLGSLRNCFS